MAKKTDRYAEVYTLDDYASSDPKMMQCLELARVATKTDLPVLILGESGTGKTLLAKAIHFSSKRSASPFVSFNAAALSDTLLDSQLFGHEKGAFTNAERRVRGKFEQADSGTLFIDEVADMSGSAQVKILRVVEYGEFERLGSEEIQNADVRLITATHLSLQNLIAEDKFRRDLFYRLSGIKIVIPPLRERPNDLRALVGAEIASAAEREKKHITGLSAKAGELLFSYSWPGNLRELSRVIHTAVAICDDSVIREEHILVSEESWLGGGAPNSQVKEQSGSSQIPAHIEQVLFNGQEDLSLKVCETEHILKVLEFMSGNKRKTAKALGVSRSTLDRKLGEIQAVDV